MEGQLTSVLAKLTDRPALAKGSADYMQWACSTREKLGVPGWVPKGFDQSLAFCPHDLYDMDDKVMSKEAERWSRLIKDHRMKAFWKKMEGIDALNGDYLGFGIACNVGLYGNSYDGYTTVTESDARNNLEEISETAAHLATLLGFNVGSPNYYAVSEKLLLPLGLSNLRNELRQVVEKANELSRSALLVHHHAFEAAVMRNNKAPYADRTFFMRCLSQFFRKDVGVPNHPLVAEITSIVFDDHDITDNMVRKATSDLTAARPLQPENNS